jgi:hypothetical protein
MWLLETISPWMAVCSDQRQPQFYFLHAQRYRLVLNANRFAMRSRSKAYSERVNNLAARSAVGLNSVCFQYGFQTRRQRRPSTVGGFNWCQLKQRDRCRRAKTAFILPTFRSGSTLGKRSAQATESRLGCRLAVPNSDDRASVDRPQFGRKPQTVAYLALQQRVINEPVRRPQIAVDL